GDERFAKALKANGKVILAEDFTLTPDGSPTISRSMDAFYDAAAANGISQLVIEEDLIMRRHLHFAPHRDAEDFSSLTWEAARVIGQPDQQNPKNRFIRRWMNYYGP